MRRQQVALTVWLVLPVVVLVVLLWAITRESAVRSRVEQAEMNPAVGAGAGDTGGVNAVGELIAGNAANHGVKEVREAEAARTAPLSSAVVAKHAVPVYPQGTIERHTVAGGGGVASGAERGVLVWLPPGYAEAPAQRYPVLYLQDGQMVFEKHPEAAAELGADEVAAELIGKGEIRPLIIVAVENSVVGRMGEYSPAAFFDPAIITPAGDAYVDWFAGTVVPLVERTYRVRGGPENTAVGGSSLGAAISLHAASRRPDLFGMVLLESMLIGSGDTGAWKQWLDGIKAWPSRAYVGIGGREVAGKPAESRVYVAANEDLDRRLKAAGLGPDRRLFVVEPAGEHNEAAWARRFPQALAFLFPPEGDSNK